VGKNTLDSRRGGKTASLHVAKAIVNPETISAGSSVSRARSPLSWPQPRQALFKTVLLMGCVLGSAGAAHADDDSKNAACEAAERALQSMSTAQRERFSQTGQTAAPCAAGPVTASPPTLRRESVHLQLFNGPGAAATARNPHRSVASRVTGSTAVAAPQRLGLSSSAARAVDLAPAVDATARRHNIDPLLLHAIAHVESRHNPQARSHAGALGVMQVMPGTGQRFGVADRAALHHVPTNLEVSAIYLKTLQDRFGNNLPLVLAAYSAGEGAVERHGRRIPPYPETQRYVADVMATYQRLGATARQVRGRPPPRGPVNTL
jgi:soluble lytic murein transglycosylase-like protein